MVSRISPSSDTYRLFFDLPTPRASLTLCPGHTLMVRLAYPLPTHCYKCQHYGHSHLACKSKQAVCGNCSHPLSDNHSPRTCSREPLCFHCKTPHAASSSTCPKYIVEKRILVLHHRDRFPLVDACRAVMSWMTQTSQSWLAPPSFCFSHFNCYCLLFDAPSLSPFLLSQYPPLLSRHRWLLLNWRCLPLNWQHLPQQWKAPLLKCLPPLFSQMGFSLPPFAPN